MNVIYLAVIFPLIGFFILSFFEDLLSYIQIVVIGVISIFLSFLIFIYSVINFHHYKNFIFLTELWTWWKLENFNINISFLIDYLSLSFLGIIIGIGLLIYIFSIWYMCDQYKKKRFFSLVNLFLSNMLLLVLSDNFILMYVGWEGVSICSYLLINFYYLKKYVGIAAIKSFIMTRIGDLFLIVAIFFLYIQYHTVNFVDIQFLIKIGMIQYKTIISCITLLLLLGAVGKSAQIPLQTWLPEAMVGPTPVSALIHAATMVTAGVYLIARNHDLFILTPNILYLVGIIGILTVFFASCSALVQVDIKRILAYSTMSQIGYMFVSLSIGAWGVAIIHLITHAFFKALLFLSTGSLISKCNNEKNIFYMGDGNLWKRLPFLYSCFLISGSSLAAFPILTAGFYSKGNILINIFNCHSILFFTFFIFSSFLTTLYIFRLIFIVFHMKSNIIHIFDSKHWKLNLSIDWMHNIPLIILFLFSTFLLKYILPDFSSVFPENNINYSIKPYLEFFSSLMVFFGIWIAYYVFIVKDDVFNKKIFKNKFLFFILNLFYRGWGFYDFYNIVFIKPYLKFMKYLFYFPNNIVTNIILKIFKKCNLYLLCLENKFLNWYVNIMIIGILCMIILIYLNIII